MSSNRRDVDIFEVGPRDGLQNEARVVPTAIKLRLIQKLQDAGLEHLEVGAFVRPDRVPQMADTETIFESLHRRGGRRARAQYWALVPNLHGLERAHALGVRSIGLFTAATDGFTKRNIGMTVAESIRVFSEVIREARRYKMGVRAYVSTAFGCPFEGEVPASKTLKVVRRLLGLGVDQIAICDTIGVTDPRSIKDVFRPALREAPGKRLALHVHDTRGTALACAVSALELGVKVFDASVGGLGGCPFAPGAAGNLATEDLCYLFERMGVRTGIDRKKLYETAQFISKAVKRPLTSRTSRAYFSASLEMRRRYL